MREYSMTTPEGSCAPQKTALPSIAGVKKGRPLMASITRNQAATIAAPMQPAMKPSRRMRLSCMPENISLAVGRARLAHASSAPFPVLRNLFAGGLAALQRRRADASDARGRRGRAARDRRRHRWMARDPLVAALRPSADVRRLDRRDPAPP